MNKDESKILAVKIIEILGGPLRVSKLCGISQPSVTLWKKRGIPKSQLNYLRLLSPEVEAIVSNEFTNFNAEIKPQPNSLEGGHA